MNREEFEALDGEQKAEFVNEKLASKTVAEIAKDEFNLSESWLYKTLGKDGYSKKRNGKFVYNSMKQPSEESISVEFEELLRHKDTLVALAKRIEADGYIKPDFSVLNEYEGEDHRFSVSLKKELDEQLKSLSERIGVTKALLISLAIHHLIQNYK